MLQIVSGRCSWKSHLWPIPPDFIGGDLSRLLFIIVLLFEIPRHFLSQFTTLSPEQEVKVKSPMGTQVVTNKDLSNPSLC